MLRVSIALALSLAPALASCGTIPLETVFVPIEDANTLKLGHSADAPGRGSIKEYIPGGERMDDWRHLLTIQFLEAERRTPEELVAELEQWTRRHGGTLEWKVLERDANSVVYEWCLADCPKQDAALRDQCEVSRVLRGNDGLHRVAYTERGRAMDPAARARYLEAFRKAYVVKGPQQEPVVLE